MNLILANIDPNIAFQFSGLPLLSLIDQSALNKDNLVH